MTSRSLNLSTGMLAFARSIQVGEGVLSVRNSGSPDAAAEPVRVFCKGVRGQSSHAQPREGKRLNPGDSNPQIVEAAMLPQDSDLLDLEFALKVLPNSLSTVACDDPEVKGNFERIVDAYRERGGFEVLAVRYAWNLANGRFAWRNRTLAESAEVRVWFEGRSVAFDPFRLSLERPSGIEGLAGALTDGSRDDVDALVAGIARGLNDEMFVANVRWTGRMRPGDEVFPSQEYLGTNRPKEISRVYAKLPVKHGNETVEQASVHSQKIGAAIRTIDDWHGDPRGPVSLNPYAGVLSEGVALRNQRETKEKAPSFSDLQKKGRAGALLEGIEAATTADELPDDAHFFVGVLVRGGVFGSTEKSDERT